MEQQTRLANAIDSADRNIRYDNCVKIVLANKSILTWILKCCVDEFKPYDLATISGCIQGKPEIAIKAVHQNEADVEKLDGNQEIVGDNSENTSIKESRVTYDLRFKAVVPDTKKPIELIINIEAQQNDPSYRIEDRVTYYLCRLISSQYGTVFTHSHYNKIQKVYSIWLYMDPSNYMKNSITKISQNHETVYGTEKQKARPIDLMCGLIVNLGDAADKTDNKIIKMMNTLLSETVSAEEKKRMLKEEFHIAMTEELESEVSEMCNLSQGVQERTKIDTIIQVGILENKSIEQITKNLVTVCGMTVDAARDIAMKRVGASMA